MKNMEGEIKSAINDIVSYIIMRSKYSCMGFAQQKLNNYLISSGVHQMLIQEDCLDESIDVIYQSLYSFRSS